MIVLWIVLGIVALLALLLIFGTAKIRIVCQEKLRVVASVCGIRFTLISDKEDPPKKEAKNLARCRNPDALLKKELRRQQKEAAKAERRRKRAEKKAARKAKKKQLAAATGKAAPTPNLKENLDMILALLKKLYRETRGKIRIRFRKMHITVGTEDAAKTAILYGVIMQSAAYLLQFVESNFTHIERHDGDMTVEPDYLSTQCRADIDIICSVKLRRAIKIGIGMLFAYRNEKSKAEQKAARRLRAEMRRKANRGKAA